jgi:RNA polymerase sigma factor (TIGR02999 family)
MRQVLVDAARHRNADKRGGGIVLAEFDEELGQPAPTPDSMLALDDALSELERLDPRSAAGVEARFFGGLSATETAALLGISEETVRDDWRGAKAWLGRRLRKGPATGRGKSAG